MARVLIVGCGCRGRALAGDLMAAGHVVRATSRDPGRRREIEALGAEAVDADPFRLGTLLRPIDGSTVVAWLMGAAEGAPEDVAALHEPRLQALLAKLVDTHVRALVYEAAGPLDPSLYDTGAEICARARETFEMPVEVVRTDPADHDAWRAAMVEAVGRTLA